MYTRNVRISYVSFYSNYKYFVYIYLGGGGILFDDNIFATNHDILKWIRSVIKKQKSENATCVLLFYTDFHLL